MTGEVTLNVAYVVMIGCFMLFVAGGALAAKAAQMAHTRQLDNGSMAGWVVAASTCALGAVTMFAGFVSLYSPLLEKLAEQF